HVRRFAGDAPWRRLRAGVASPRKRLIRLLVWGRRARGYEVSGPSKRRTTRPRQDRSRLTRRAAGSEGRRKSCGDLIRAFHGFGVSAGPVLRDLCGKALPDPQRIRIARSPDEEGVPSLRDCAVAESAKVDRGSAGTCGPKRR